MRTPFFQDVRGRTYYGSMKPVREHGKMVLVAGLLLGMLSIGAVTQISLTSQVQGVLPVANGGTAAATFTAHYFFGNNGGTTAAPAAALIGTADVSPQAYIAGGGSGTALTATPSPAIPALASGLYINLLSGYANSGTTPTFAPNGLTAKTITKCGTTALVANDINTTAIAELVYDGTEWQLLNPQVTPCGTLLTGTFADNETPSGSLPGTSLTLAHTPSPAASLCLFMNGQELVAGGADYSLSTATITLTNSAPSGTVFRASYRY